MLTTLFGRAAFSVSKTLEALEQLVKFFKTKKPITFDSYQFNKQMLKMSGK